MRFIALKEDKITTVMFFFCFFRTFFHLFFTLNSVIFVDGSARIFLAPGRRAS